MKERPDPKTVKARESLLETDATVIDQDSDGDDFSGMTPSHKQKQTKLSYGSDGVGTRTHTHTHTHTHKYEGR